MCTETIQEKIEELQKELQKTIEEHNAFVAQRDAKIRRIIEIEASLKTLNELNKEEEPDG
tara:strand:+ start:3377 stop:3556 length:180 start_codon:yes stop_codon:yes gene_type:complete